MKKNRPPYQVLSVSALLVLISGSSALAQSQAHDDWNRFAEKRKACILHQDYEEACRITLEMKDIAVEAGKGSDIVKLMEVTRQWVQAQEDPELASKPIYHELLDSLYQRHTRHDRFAESLEVLTELYQLQSTDKHQLAKNSLRMAQTLLELNKPLHLEKTQLDWLVEGLDDIKRESQIDMYCRRINAQAEQDGVDVTKEVEAVRTEIHRQLAAESHRLAADAAARRKRYRITNADLISDSEHQMHRQMQEYRRKMIRNGY